MLPWVWEGSRRSCSVPQPSPKHREGGRVRALPGTDKLPQPKVGIPSLAARGEQLGKHLPEQNEKAITADSLLSCLLSVTRRWQRGDRAPLSPLGSSRLRIPVGTSLKSGCSLTSPAQGASAGLGIGLNQNKTKVGAAGLRWGVRERPPAGAGGSELQGQGSMGCVDGCRVWLSLSPGLG